MTPTSAKDFVVQDRLPGVTFCPIAVSRADKEKVRSMLSVVNKYLGLLVWDRPANLEI